VSLIIKFSKFIFDMFLFRLILFTCVFVLSSKLAWAQKINEPTLPMHFTDTNNRYCEWESWGFNNIPDYLCTCNNLDAAKTTQTNTLWSAGSLGLNLSGAGLNKLGLWDGGRARTTHAEFGGRIVIMDSGATVSAHTTAVAGNLMAAGINANAKGMSYATQLKNWNFTNDNAEIIAAAPDLFLSNHSYASTAAWTNIGGQIYWYGDSSLHPTRDWKFGYYDNRSRIWDSVMHANPYYLMVKASGNDRGNGVAPGIPHYYWNGSAWAISTTVRDTVGPYDCISTFGNAKNILCVGAVPAMPAGIPANVNTLSFSTWGPTDDGRIKPDLVAASGSIMSVGSASDTAYAALGGTSIAAPNVTGSLLLMQQLNFQLKGRYMLNATLKALAIHSARRCNIALPGPDYACGWGIPNFKLAAQIIKDSIQNSIQEITLLNQDSFTFFVYATPEDTLKNTLVWTDPKGITSLPAYNDTSLKLVNDLDMRLYNLADSLIAMPFVLNPNNPSLPATTGDNFRDNVEQIYQTNLPSAWYKIKVKHKNNLQNNLPQKFSLIVSGTNTLSALPVSYLNMSAKQISAKEIQLSWSTVQEINNHSFEVLHGIQADKLEAISTVLGKGNSHSLHHYSYKHRNEKGFSGSQYFQLLQKDFDGKSSYSKTISLAIEEPLCIQSVVPNPFTDKLTLYYNSGQSTVQLKLYSLSGKLLLEADLPASSSGAYPLDLQNLERGMYLLMLYHPSSGEFIGIKIAKI